jgi:hypothetical protein
MAPPLARETVEGCWLLSDPMLGIGGAVRWPPIYLADKFISCFRETFVTADGTLLSSSFAVHREWVEIEASRPLQIADVRDHALRLASVELKVVAERCFTRPENFDGICFALTKARAICWPCSICE